MSSETQTGVHVGSTGDRITGGAVAGVVASAIMGVPMLAQMAGVLEQAIPAMYDIAGPASAAGFALHLFHGAVFGIVFAGALATSTKDAGDPSLVRTTGIGVGYGLFVWVVAAVVVMPLWLSAAGFPVAPSVPNVSVPSLVGHAVYGASLGLVYALLAER